MNCHDKDKCCHPYPIEPAPFAPGGCDPHPPCPPRPPRPPFKPGCPPSQYIGSRYVPIFADPLEWDKSKAYESLTIVTYNGESYTSRCNVAPGIDITNTTYWAKTGAYNAILEQYRTEVSDLSSQVTGFAADNKEFREKIDGYDKDNAAMKETASSYTEKVDKLTERVTADEADIDALQATTAQHTKDIADLKAKDADLQQQITANDTDIANINDYQAEQDSRLDSVEAVNTKQETAIAKNASDISAEVKRASAAEVANGKLIARNAEELARHAEELTDHEKRITALETDNVTNKADIRAIIAKNTEQDATIAAAKDAATHAQEAAERAEGKADANSATIGSWEANHPGKTISQAVTAANGDIINANTQITDVKNGLSSTNEKVTGLENSKANKTELDAYVKTTVYTAGKEAQDEKINALSTNELWIDFPAGTITHATGLIGAVYPVGVFPWFKYPSDATTNDFKCYAYSSDASHSFTTDDVDQCANATGLADATLIFRPAESDPATNGVPAICIIADSRSIDKSFKTFKVKVVYSKS